MRTIGKTLSWKMSFLVLLAIGAALLFNQGGYLLGGKYIEDRFDNDTYYAKMDEKYADRLQSFVTREKVSLEGGDEQLGSWVQKQKLITLWIYRDHRLMYTSSVDETEEFISSYTTCIEVRFADGTAQVYMDGAYLYSIYNTLTIVLMCLSFILLFLILLFGVRRKIRLLVRMRDGVEILKRGDLDYLLPVRGQDEIAQLAVAINAMSASLKEQFEREQELQSASQALIRDMSHDLRTPLTAILLYLELLRKGGFRDEEQMWAYIGRIEVKARQMKAQTDNLFAYALVGVGERVQLVQAGFKETFHDRLSDACGYLGENGFSVQARLQEQEAQIQIFPDYASRLLDNLVSNLIKYADPGEPVHIRTSLQEQEDVLEVSNTVRAEVGTVDSNGIGLMNIRKMMENMHGSSEIVQEGKTFTVALHFARAGR